MSFFRWVVCWCSQSKTGIDDQWTTVTHNRQVSGPIEIHLIDDVIRQLMAIACSRPLLTSVISHAQLSVTLKRQSVKMKTSRVYGHESYHQGFQRHVFSNKEHFLVASSLFTHVSFVKHCWVGVVSVEHQMEFATLHQRHCRCTFDVT